MSTQTEFNFNPRMDELTAGFVGREWLIETIDQVIAGDTDRYIVIVGEAGIGKSALCARLIRLGRVAAYHFCLAREGGTLEPLAFARSLSAQLANSLPGFGEQLINQAPMQKFDVTQEIGELHGGAVYGVYIDKFIVQTRSADHAFQVLVREPLRSWAATQPASVRVVVLTDALDEAARLDRHPNIADLIDSARDLPDQVRWVLTSRPAGPFAMLPGQRQMLIDQSSGNLIDIGAYIDQALAEQTIRSALQQHGVDAAELRATLLDRSHGNFLYLKYVLQGLRDDCVAGRRPTAPAQLPIGLDQVYQEFLGRVLARKAQDDWRRMYRPVLGVLAVAQEPLSFESLATLSGANEQDASDVVEDLRQFLNVPLVGDAGMYQIYHASFADFLTDRQRNPAYWIDPLLQNSQLVEQLFARYGPTLAQCRSQMLDRYALRQAATHLNRAARLAAERGQLERQHQLTQQLARLALAEAFQDGFGQYIGDLAALQRIVTDALRLAAADLQPDGLPLLIETALAQESFRRKRLQPEPLFALARQGKLGEAISALAAFGLERQWQQAAQLTLAWLALPAAQAAVTTLCARLAADWTITWPLGLFVHRVQLGLQGAANGLPPLPAPPPEHVVEQLIKRMAGQRSDSSSISAFAAEFYPQMNEMLQQVLGQSGDQAPVFLAQTDGPMLVAYALANPVQGQQYLERYLAIFAANDYLYYRNLSLWILLEAVLRHPDQQWTRTTVAALMLIALQTEQLHFHGGLLAALSAWRAAQGDPTALARISQKVDTALNTSTTRPRDPQALHKRELAALAEAATLLPDRAAVVERCLAAIRALPGGLAGYHASAWLSLADTIRICQPANTQQREWALRKATQAAQNIQDELFCIRMNARVNAFRKRRWQTDTSSTAILERVLSFCSDPGQPLFAPVHIVQEAYSARKAGPNQHPLPDSIRQANTLEQLAENYRQPLAALLRLNPQHHGTDILARRTLVLVPDPEFAALLAAHFAAEILSTAGLSSAQRIGALQALAPVAATNPTTLDTVLARLMLAARPDDPAVLAALERIVPDAA